MNKKFMELAILEAKKNTIDIPIGCVIVKDNKVISSGCNTRELNKKFIEHAEIIAINRANEYLNNWRLIGCDLYVTLEPCPMCAWAILQSRISNIYFGAYDLLYGAFGSKINLSSLINKKHQNINILGGIMELECKELIDNYFKSLRRKGI